VYLEILEVRAPEKIFWPPAEPSGAVSKPAVCGVGAEPITVSRWTILGQIDILFKVDVF